MTDRHSGYLIALDHDIREDDAEHIINAIRMIKGVISVKPIPGMPPEAWVAEERRDRQWQDALLGLLKAGPRDDE